MLVVLLAFAISAFVVPTLSNIATTDDWGYTRSVEILYYDSKLTVFSVVAATAIGQILWGGLFALIFGMTLGVMRLSTVVMVALGAISLYSILRQLGVNRNRSALGVAVYLFNPLSFMLAFTFMTDPHFASVMLISTALYVRGLRQDRPDWRIVVAASFFAGWAFLIRQQGALIPFAIGCYLLVSRQLWFNWRSVNRLAQIAALPVAMLIGYYISLRWINPDALIQDTFFQQATGTGWSGGWYLLRYLTYIEMAYAGAFVLPLVLATLPATRECMRQLVTGSLFGWTAFLLWISGLGVGGYVLTEQGRKMPYISQFAGLRGMGPADVPGARKMLTTIEWIPDALTIVSIASTAVLGLVLCRKIVSEETPERAVAGLLVMVGLWQWIGVLPPSYHYINRGGSLDRYLLPLFPIVIALMLWAVRDLRLIAPVAWLAVAALAVFSTAGARDYLVYIGAVWNMAHTANADGIPNTKIDAGSAWDGYHLYTNLQEKPGNPVMTPGTVPWWVRLYARSTDSTYLVSTNPAAHEGYVVVDQREYSSWLEDDPVFVYLLRRGNGA